MRRRRGRRCKRLHQAPRDQHEFSRALRRINERIQARDFAAGLADANRELERPRRSPHDESRVLALVADSEFKRGAFEEAAGIYLRSATRVLDHHRAWLRPQVGAVRTLLRAARVDEAMQLARQSVAVAQQKMEAFDGAVRRANEELAAKGSVRIPELPARVSVVATRLGYLFLQEGEPEAARELFEKAVTANPRGACRARQGLAQVALSNSDPVHALGFAMDAIRRGKYGAKTVPAWPLVIAARRKLGGWRISDRLIRGLRLAPSGVRARTVLTIVRELRRQGMRQWQEVAGQWLEKEGRQFPIIAVELRKLQLASARVEGESAARKREAAERLLEMPGLTAVEWLAATKEWVRAGLWEGRRVDLEAQVNLAAARYGQEFAARAAHSMALSCMKARRHDLARKLLQRNVERLAGGSTTWARSVWALARMESLLGHHAAAAVAYRAYVEARGIPERFHLQAQLLWAQSLIAAGHPDALVAARPRISAVLQDVQDFEVLLNFARQLAVADPNLEAWADELFERGADLARRQFSQSTHPSLAVEVLFKLTRRQVLDFGRSADALAFWQGLSGEKKAWLWSTKSRYWEYLGLLVDGHLREQQFDEAAAFANSWMEDPATPPEGRLQVGMPYALALMHSRAAAAAMEIFEQFTRESPAHPVCAAAWYWKALAAHRRGDVAARNRCAISLRQAQGLDPAVQRQWYLDAKALLLLADLQVERVDREATNYEAGQLHLLLRELSHEMELLP